MSIVIARAMSDSELAALLTTTYPRHCAVDDRDGRCAPERHTPAPDDGWGSGGRIGLRRRRAELDPRIAPSRRLRPPDGVRFGVDDRWGRRHLRLAGALPR